MGLLQPARMETGFLKAGFLGFAGAGKTHTAFLLAMGLLEEIGDDRPLAMVDTEAGSDWWVPRVEAAGRKLVVAKTRAFADLMTVTREVEGANSILIVDSISHIWKELLEAYQRKFKVSRLAFHHWNVIKPEWARFTDWMLNSRIHVIIAGRAGYEYDYEEDESGHKELVKTGIKMKAESEFGFEPSLLVEMTKVKHSVTLKDPDAKGWIHRATILKDRADKINGEEFDNPTYADFLPHLNAINIGGDHRVIDADRKSDDMFDDRDHSLIKRKRLVEVTLEEIQDVFVLAEVSSRTDAGKKEMKVALKDAFGTSAWSAVQNLPLEALQEGLLALRKRFDQLEAPEPPKDPLDDPLPWESEEEAKAANAPPGKQTHGPISVGMDAAIVAPEEDEPTAYVDTETGELFEPEPEQEVLESIEPGSKKAQYAALYEDAMTAAHPDWGDKERLDWQQSVIKKRNRGHWTVVDYIRAISELGGMEE